jgi:hypothetical protein
MRMDKRLSLFRLGLVGLAGVVGFGSLLVASGSLVACESLSETSPLPDLDAQTFDVGYVPPFEEKEEEEPPPPDAGPPPPASRIRLANLLQGPEAVDLCVKQEPTGAWEGQKITVDAPSPKADGLAFGEVSAHNNLPVAGAAARYSFRVVPVGGPCDGDGAVIYATIGPTTLRQGAGVTLVAVGVVDPGVDAGDANPRGVAIGDVLAPPATVTLVRLVHGVPDLPALDLVINGETVATGVKYGTATGFPYTSTTGFASLAAGIPANATLSLRAGTTVRSFAVPDRVRRGVAMTIFAAGSISGGDHPLQVLLCADRSPPAGETLARCTKLDPIE